MPCFKVAVIERQERIYRVEAEYTQQAEDRALMFPDGCEHVTQIGWTSRSFSAEIRDQRDFTPTTSFDWFSTEELEERTDQLLAAIPKRGSEEAVIAAKVDLADLLLELRKRRQEAANA